MKIKHWQGYGCVNMKVLLNTPKKVIIEVYGNHEYGLKRYDKYDISDNTITKTILFPFKLAINIGVKETKASRYPV